MRAFNENLKRLTLLFFSKKKQQQLFDTETKYSHATMKLAVARALLPLQQQKGL